MNVTVWISAMASVMCQSILSPAETTSGLGDISSTAVWVVSVPADAWKVWVPSGFAVEVTMLRQLRRRSPRRCRR